MNTAAKRKPALGVDIGGVILDYVPHIGTELSFDGERYFETPEVEGAVEALAALNSSGPFKDSIYLVSNIVPGSTHIPNWLSNRNILARIGIPQDHLEICHGRSAKEAIVARLGITHFVDDRAEVMSYMIGKVPNLYLFQGLNSDDQKFAEARAQMKHVHSWAELLKLLSE